MTSNRNTIWWQSNWVVLAAAALAFFFNLGAVPLFDLDEGAFSAATWEMLQRGDYITTYLNGELRFDKPILIYWLQALSVSLFGLHEWALRLPSALCATLWVLSVAVFCRPRLGNDGAVAAGVIAATALAVTVIGRAATADALLNLLITLTMLDMYRYIEAPKPATLYRVFAWIGLGTLAKGPVAIAIPLITSLLFFALQRDVRGWLRAVFNPVGIAVFVAIAAPWYILELIDQGQAFIDGFILKHNVGRFADTMEGHGGHWYYYLAVLPFVVLPFTALMLRSLRQLTAVRTDLLDRWLWLWFGLVLVLFSFSSTQLPHYILYGSTALFILMARHRALLQSRWLAFAPVVTLLIVLAALPDLLPLATPNIKDKLTQAMLERSDEAFGLGYRLGVTASLVIVIAIALWRRLTIWQGLLLAGAIQALSVVAWVGPAVAELQQAPLKRAALMVRDLGEPTVMWGLNMPSFTVYRGAVTPRREPQRGELVVTKHSRLDALPPHDLLFNEGGIVLARIHHLPP
jgi:4-amino-4-deoxy-L-arabinose transferase-like glycosyltransferase